MTSSMTKLYPFVDKMDNDANLNLYCYTDHESTSQNEYDFFVENEYDISQTRGVVIDNNDKIIFKGFSKSDEIALDQAVTIDSFFDYVDNTHGGLANVKIFKSYEGAMIRMFYNKDKWYISTNKKLDAFKSRWSSPESYGTRFKKSIQSLYDTSDAFKQRLDTSSQGSDISVLDKFYTTLDKTVQYVFLVTNSFCNRIVCNPSEKPEVFHVGTFKEGMLTLDNDIGINKPEQLNFTDKSEVTNFVSNLNPYESPGVIIFLPGNVQVKLNNSEYQRLFNIRGNQASVKFRYIQLRNDKDKTKELSMLYPEYVESFKEYEKNIQQECDYIHDMYMNKFVFKQQVNVSNYEYKIMKIAHTWYRSDSDNRKVTKNLIHDIVNDQESHVVNQLIKQLKNNTRRFKKTNTPQTSPRFL